MNQPNQRLTVFLSLFMLGITSQVMQAWLVRETLVVFYGNELSLGAVFGSWLTWIALGSLAVIWLRERQWVKKPARGLSSILLLLPLLMALQVVAVRAIRRLLDTPSLELVPLGELFPSVALLTLPIAMALGLAFPLSCKALSESGAKTIVRGISWLYVAEAAGALLGGILFTFLFIQWLGMWRGLGLLALPLAFLAWRLRPTKGTKLTAGVIALSGLLLVATPLSGLVNSWLETFRFHTMQPGMTLLDAVETRYGHVAYARLGDQVSVVQDGRIAESFPQPEAIQQTAAYVYAQSKDAQNVLVFGSFAGGLVAELLRYPVKHIDVVLQDASAFAHLRPYLTAENRAALEDGRLQLRFGDSRRYLRRLTDQRYDLVLALDAAPTSAHSNRFFTREFYSSLQAHMADSGVFCTQVSSASNYLGGTVRSYAGSIFRTLSGVFPEVSVMPGDIHLYCAGNRAGQVSEDPAELSRRYLATELDEHRFPAGYFSSLLPQDRIRDLHRQFEEHPGELNSDVRPVTFYLNMLLWARFTASALADWLEQLRSMQAWPYLVPVLAFLGLWLLRTLLAAEPAVRTRRQAGSFALVLLGLVAMALQLVVLFDYQAHVGFMFERIALLNALFMTGLALGTGVLGQAMTGRGRPETWLMALLLLVTVILLFTPSALAGLGRLDGWSQEAAYLGISCLYGLLTGAGFPLGVHLAQAELGEAAPTGGVSEAADSLGGAAGGLITGALLIPLMGMNGTCKLLALLSLATLMPLAWARWAPPRVEVLAARGYRAFPWSGMGWTLAFLVIVLFGWHWLQRGTEAPPQLHFDDTLLARVSGSKQFEIQESPVPYYLGRDADTHTGGVPDTVSLSSMNAAADVSGYGGPLNLLVSVDREGKLRGVHYVDSSETPSYISDIGTWLANLSGLDLADVALDPQRVDTLSGATVSSKAALESINRTVAFAGKTAFGKDFAPMPKEKAAGSALWTPRFLATLVLLLASVPIYLSGNEKARLGLLAASLGILGFWLNSLVTEVDLVNLALGHLASLADNPQRWLLLGFVLISGVLFGQIWCGCLCPFGAAQEFLSRLGRRLGLRRYVHWPLDRSLRFLKYLLLGLMLVAVLLYDEPFWASFNPMQHAFGKHLAGWVLLVLGVSLGGSLFYVRFWCRYFCPFGAFLSLSNKFALLQHLAPRRRFEHCDLGVRDEFDMDCIRCNRCLHAQDTHVMHKDNP
jgi:predicted membrane-bound spermidine synthase/Na+-translocating ferredoxin:NAD+ oxidoreductase RnfG subunit